MDVNGLLWVFQLIGVTASVFGTFSALRARDNERAGKISEMQTEIRHLIRHTEKLQKDVDFIRRRMSAEYGEGRESA